MTRLFGSGVEPRRLKPKVTIGSYRSAEALRHPKLERHPTKLRLDSFAGAEKGRNQNVYVGCEARPSKQR
jgi:hypothetical protein